MKFPVAAYCAVLAIAFSALRAQVAPALKFEVASVKVSQSPMEMLRAGRGMASGMPVFSGQRVEIGTMAMKSMIAAAYRVDVQHVTSPAWTAQAYFAIQAVMPEGATKEQYPDMLKALLEERFHLVARRAMTHQSGYALTVAKGGAKMKAPGEVDRSGCDTWRDAPAFPGAKLCNAAQDSDEGRITFSIATDSKWGPSRSSSAKTRTEMEFFAITMPQLADYLAGVVLQGPGRVQAMSCRYWTIRSYRGSGISRSRESLQMSRSVRRTARSRRYRLRPR